MVKNLPAMRETWVRFLGWEDPLETGTAPHPSILAWRIPWPEEPGGLYSPWGCRVRKLPWRRDRLPMPVFLGFPGGSDSKESACDVGDLGFISGLGTSPGDGNGYPLQYSGLENSMDYIVRGVTKNRTQLRDFHFHTLQNKTCQEKKCNVNYFCSGAPGPVTHWRVSPS